MNKLDLSKKYKAYFTAKTKPELVSVETANFISICGKGNPSGDAFAKRIEALYSTAYAIKFVHKAQDRDFIVSKLEGLWWFDEQKFGGSSIADTPVEIPRSEWEYRLMIRMPDYVSQTDIHSAAAAVTAKKGIRLASEVAYHTLSEGLCVQMLHIGPFSTEPESLKEIMAFCKAGNLAKNGFHHEIYLSDFRKTEPARLKTILREPVLKRNNR